MNKLYAFRVLRLKDIEIFQFKENRFGEIIGYMGLVDFNRPSNLDDFPYIKELEDPNDFGQENFIKALFISNEPIKDDIKDYLNEFADSLIGNKNDCDWNIDFISLSTDLSKSKPMNVLTIYSEILCKSYGLDLKLPTITSEKFNHLSQD